MNLLGLIVALLCNTALAVVDKKTGQLIKSDKNVLPFSFFKTLLCGVFAVILLPFGKQYISFDGTVISVLAGLFHAFSVVLIMHSLRSNPAVYVNLFMASGILLPTCFDWIFVYKTINLPELFLLICIILSLSAVLNFKKGKSKFGLLIVMFFYYGMLMVMQGSFPKVCENGSKTMFSAIMYMSSALILGTICMFRRANFVFEKELKIFAVSASVLNLAINLLLTTLSASLPSSAVFPVVHGLKLVAITLLSPLLWKEKLTVKQIIGSFVTIIFICILGG